METKEINSVHVEQYDASPPNDYLGKDEESPSSLSPTQDWTPEEERKLVWKIDLRVFPMLCVVFGLSLLDRTNISAAYIAGLAVDLELAVGSRYSVALLVFFIGYFLFELPSNYIIRRIGARWWLSFLIVAWGLMVLAMGFIHHWKILVVLRAFLGIFEAGLFPGSIYIIGCWYKQFETGRRISLFYMASLFSSGFGPIFAYVLSLIRVGGPGSMYRSGWRWIFIIEGIATVFAGLVAPFFLVEFPERVKFLNPRQKHIALERVKVDKLGKEVVHPTVKEMLVMLADWKIALYCIQYFICASSVYSLAYFTPIILRQGMGFSYAKAQLLQSPPYVFTIIMSLTMAYISDKIKMRWPILCSQAATGIVGLLIILYVKAPAVRYVGLFLAIFGCQANIPATLAYGNNQTGRNEKKGVVAAAMISSGALGGIAGSTIFRSQDAPLYMPGTWSTISMLMLYIIITISMSMHFKRQNRLADEAQAEGRQYILEKTPGFRYAP
ncbi:hypothetical protein LTR70_009327 [Exophiala xenobiotica]|uniref:Major facilitator superfamily (MFS) profile domain-containing protein n=1 Tax=Lithohypha guttulata TaxID=1690604 RepID=A0ABR0K271_9EURO|nr:hypothetical protein LTR24_008337 [Lithohypha guttulata]KAK5310642.1 hypothetical protein LTR70_009327 [Exophiala xenobiotica]